MSFGIGGFARRWGSGAGCLRRLLEFRRFPDVLTAFRGQTVGVGSMSSVKMDGWPYRVSPELSVLSARNWPH